MIKTKIKNKREIEIYIKITKVIQLQKPTLKLKQKLNK